MLKLEFVILITNLLGEYKELIMLLEQYIILCKQVIMSNRLFFAVIT
jgi:hypothetical protein